MRGNTGKLVCRRKRNGTGCSRQNTLLKSRETNYTRAAQTRHLSSDSTRREHGSKPEDARPLWREGRNRLPHTGFNDRPIFQPLALTKAMWRVAVGHFALDAQQHAAFITLNTCWLEVGETEEPNECALTHPWSTLDESIVHFNDWFSFSFFVVVVLALKVSFFWLWD